MQERVAFVMSQAFGAGCPERTGFAWRSGKSAAKLRDAPADEAGIVAYRDCCRLGAGGWQLILEHVIPGFDDLSQNELARTLIVPPAVSVPLHWLPGNQAERLARNQQIPYPTPI